jgi:hypothetical protein
MSNPSVNKRQKERNRQDKQREKEAMKQQRKQEKVPRAAGAEGEDPDLAGMVAGPQPIPEEDEPPQV